MQRRAAFWASSEMRAPDESIRKSSRVIGVVRLRQTLGAACGLVLALTSAGADGPRPVVADFKLKVALFDAGTAPLETSELVAHQGRVYQFRSNSSEVVIVLPASDRVDLIDVGANQRVQTSITLRKLDDALGKLKDAIAASIAKRETE